MSRKIGELEMLLTPPQDKEHLQFWIKNFLGFTLPDCKVTDIADSSPLDFVWEVYCAIMDGKPLHIMALSGRDSAKTVSLAVIDLLSLIFDQRGAAHIGMTKQQAQRAREYLEKYIMKQPLLKGAIVKQNTTEIRMIVGGEEVGLELVPCVPKAVQGLHTSLISYDELSSSTDPLHVKAYRDSSGIPGSSRKGKPAIIVKITSRQSGFSLAEQEIKNSQKSGIKIVKWTTIDSMKKCPESRCGTEPFPLWINLTKGFKYTDEEFAQLPEKQQDGFQRATETRKGCLSCPLAVYCQGKARHQSSESVLLREIDDVISKVNSSGSHEWVLSQLMSMQPSSEGLVYFEFNRSIHIPGWEKMWEILTGEVPTTPVSRDQFIARLKRMSATFLAGIDWGWSAPSTCVVLAIDGRDNIYVLDAIGRTFTNDPDWVDTVKTQIHARYNMDMFVPDPENQSGLSIMRSQDLPVAEVDKGPGSVKAGINCVKRRLRVPGTNKDSKFFIAPDIEPTVTNHPGLVDEFELYKKQVDATGKILDDANPEKGNDHFLDAVRYPIFWYFGKAVGQAVFASEVEQQQRANVSNPSMEELARRQGVKFIDNRTEFDQMGPQPKDPKKPDDPNDPNTGNSGGGMRVAWT